MTSICIFSEIKWFFSPILLTFADATFDSPSFSLHYKMMNGAPPPPFSGGACIPINVKNPARRFGRCKATLLWNHVYCWALIYWLSVYLSMCCAWTFPSCLLPNQTNPFIHILNCEVKTLHHFKAPWVRVSSLRAILEQLWGTIWHFNLNS